LILGTVVHRGQGRIHRSRSELKVPVCEEHIPIAGER